MPKLKLQTTAGKEAGDITLSDAVFGIRVNRHLLWETTKWQLAKRRQGTHSTKTRAEVRGTNKKPFKQKGTGRARAGSTQSPIWVGGGVVFGPKPRDYSYPMPKKARKSALRSALSLCLNEGRIVVVDSFDAAGGKTKIVATALAKLGSPQPSKKVLIVDSEDNKELARAAKNLASSQWISPGGLNVYDVLKADTVVFTKAGLSIVEAALSDAKGKAA